MQRERVLGKTVGYPSISVRGPQWVGDIGHVYMVGTGERRMSVAPSSVKLSGHGDISTSRLDRRCDAGAYS